MSNNKLSSQIETVLKKRNLDYRELMEMNKGEIIERLSVYHEELVFQNEELRRTNVNLQEMTQTYQELYQETPIPIVLIDKNSMLKDLNNSARLMLKLPPDELPEFPEFISPTSQDTYYLFVKKILQHPKDNHQVQLDMVVEDETFNVSIYANMKKKDDDEHIRIVIMDETEQRKFQNRIQYLVEHDQLTNLYNRRYFENCIIELEDAPFQKLGVVYIDLNNLKLVNDAFGHERGDQVLIALGKSIQDVLEKEDILCRIGGDEFTAFIKRNTTTKIQNTIDAIKMVVSSMHVNDLEISASIGAAIRSNEFISIDSLIKIAEENMYQEKIYASKSGKLKIVGSILSGLYGKHPVEEQHSTRVAELMRLLAVSLGYNEGDQVRLRSAGLLHDIGKIAINYTILENKRKLTDDEYADIKRHPEIGYKILLSSRTEGVITEAVLMHHERMDGKGYPRGLKGPQISEPARMLQICDSFDAMISERPYKQAKTVAEAVQELRRCSKTQFDHQLVEIFILDVIPKVHALYDL